MPAITKVYLCFSRHPNSAGRAYIAIEGTGLQQGWKAEVASGGHTWEGTLTPVPNKPNFFYVRLRKGRSPAKGTEPRPRTDDITVTVENVSTTTEGVIIEDSAALHGDAAEE